MHGQYYRQGLTYIVAPKAVSYDEVRAICVNEGPGALLYVLG